MIALARECLTFRLNNGESIPYSADMLSVELVGETAQWLDSEVVNQAANAVFHYFQNDLGRHSVTVGEFAGALEKVLRGFQRPQTTKKPAVEPAMLEYDLSGLAQESGKGCELFFFPRLRAELRHQLNQSPRVLRFRGLRGCVKRLAGAQHWSARCRSLQGQIVDFLRECLEVESRLEDFAMIVE
jgi:hypothetical protein